MESHRKLLLILGLLIVLFGCGKVRLPIPSPRGDLAKTKVVRVGLIEKTQSVDFMIKGSFSVYDKNGRFVARGLKGHRWRARIAADAAPEIEYRLKFVTTRSYDDAAKSTQFLADRKIRYEVLKIEDTSPASVYRDDDAGVTYHVVAWQIFSTREQAEKKRKQLSSRAPFEIFPFNKNANSKTIEIVSQETDQTLQFPSGSRLDTDRFALFGVPVGEGYHWQENENRVYRGLIEFLVDDQKRMTVVNILPIESYLRGVVPSEMPKEFPLAALKAQAIAARSEVIKKLARHASDGFDICANVHCQVYSGINREHENSNRAVDETTGQVLMKSGVVVEAVYNGVCGGHSESNEYVWNGAPQSHLRAIFDGKGAPDLLNGYLQRESVLRRWVSTPAPAYCNTISAEIPASLEYTRKYYRWQLTVPRVELENYIRAETGETFGNLQNIIPLERGLSGRLNRIRIVGTTKSFVIEKELAIRRALSATTLFSSCFVVDRQMSPDNIPVTFTFHGAGWGHGVGMCQTGAAMMALQGATLEQIIDHYYAGAEIGKLTD